MSNDPRANLVEAALACFADYGARKTSLSDVARRAGVSRTTVYRVFGSKPALVGYLAGVEVNRYLAALDREVDWSAGPEDALRAAIAFTLEHLRSHAALQRILRDEPAEIVDVLVERPGRRPLVDVLTEPATHIIESRLGTKGLRVAPAIAAEWTVRAIYSLLLVPTSGIDDPDQIAELVLHGIAERPRSD